MLETQRVMARVLLYMLEVHVCKLKAVEGGFGLLEALEVLEMPEVIRCALLCMLLEAVEGMLCSLEVLEALQVVEVMRRVLLCMLEAVGGSLCLLEVQRCGGWVHFCSRCWGCWRCRR